MNLGPAEIGMLLVILVLVFGPARIGDIGKSMGEALAGFRKASKEAVEPTEPVTVTSEPKEKPMLSEGTDGDESPADSLALETPEQPEAQAEKTT